MILIGLFLLHIHCIAGHVPLPLPKITTASINAQSEENTTILLPCAVENLGGNIVRWWKGELILYDSNDLGLIPPNRLRIWSNNSLQISNLSKNDSGEYVCQIVRADPWSPIELRHFVQVLYPPQVFPVPSDGKVTSRLGDDVEMGCLATGMPPPRVMWFSKNIALGPGDNQHRLRFKAGDHLMTGTFTCRADNGIGKAAETEIFLRIKYKPEVTISHPRIHVAPGLRAELTCKVNGDPEPKIRWFFEGAPLEYLDISNSRIVTESRGDKSLLIFRNLRPTDFGSYACRAENSEGISEAFVDVTGVPHRANFKKTANRTNTSVSLVWEVDSYTPIIEYSLSFRELLPGADDSEWVRIIVPADGYSPGPIHSKAFTIHGLQEGTIYQALISSRNRYGWSEPSPLYHFGTEGSQEPLQVEPETTEEILTTRPTLSPEVRLQVAIELNQISERISSHGLNKKPCFLFVVIVIFIVNKIA